MEAQYIQSNPTAYQAELNAAIAKLKDSPDITASQKDIIGLLENGVPIQDIYQGLGDIWTDKNAAYHSSYETTVQGMNVPRILAELGVVDPAVADAATIIEGTQGTQALAQSQLTGDYLHDLGYNFLVAGTKMLPQVAAAFIPFVGLPLSAAATGISSYGNYAEQARLEGATLDQQKLYGGLSGAVEAGLSLIPLQKMLKVPEKVLQNTLWEVGEENTTNFITNFFAKMIYKPDMKWYSAERGEDAVFSLPQFLDTTIISGLLGGMTSTMGIVLAGKPNASDKAIKITAQDGSISVMTDQNGDIVLFDDKTAKKFIRDIQKRDPDTKIETVDMSKSKSLKIAQIAGELNPAARGALNLSGPKDTNTNITFEQRIGQNDIITGQRAKPLIQAIEQYLPEVKLASPDAKMQIYVETDGTNQIVRIETLDTSLGLDYYTAKEGNVGRVYEPLRGGRAFEDVTRQTSKELPTERIARAGSQAAQPIEQDTPGRSARLADAVSGDPSHKNNHDPFRDVFGPGRESHPIEWADICNKVKEAGGKVRYVESSTMGYSPLGREVPGEIAIKENSSYFALLHEYQHFLDDMKDGWLGWETVFNYKLRIIREEKAYLLEIGEAERLGLYDVAKQLWVNYLAERTDILGKFGPLTLGGGSNNGFTEGD